MVGSVHISLDSFFKLCLNKRKRFDSLGGKKTFLPSVGYLYDLLVLPSAFHLPTLRINIIVTPHPYPQNEAIPCARAEKVRPLLTISPNWGPLGKSLGQRMVCSTMGVTVNQHPPMHHEGWMISGLETVFCYVPVNPS
jgi:hypothetical protein